MRNAPMFRRVVQAIVVSSVCVSCGLVLGLESHELAGADGAGSDGGGDATGGDALASQDGGPGGPCVGSGCSFYPSGVVTQGDLSAVGTSAITVTGTTTIHTDTGAIDGVRAAGAGVVSGIGFRSSGGMGIFTFAGLTISAPVVHLDGINAVALVSSAKIVINGGLDAQGSCTNGSAGPGGGKGGNGGPGEGAGGGGAASGAFPYASGGGGGGFGDLGGKGGDCSNATGGAGGIVYGTASLLPLFGGAGGGTGLQTGSVSQGMGGGGGGAVQLVAADAVQIDGSINAGGCGGTAGGCLSGCSNGGSSGGGGGAGGAILIEAPTVHINGVLAANGGGGGSGNHNNNQSQPGVTNGRNGLAATTPASGGTGDSTKGGAGGAAGSPAGKPGENFAGSGYSGGGGGAAGRIRINTQSGIANINGVLSPSLGDGLDAGKPLATQGKIDVH